MSAPLCEAAIALDLSKPGTVWVECGKAAIQVHRYGCVHEHVVERFTCLEHSPVLDDVGCRQCFTASDNPHDCPMAFELVRS